MVSFVFLCLFLSLVSASSFLSSCQHPTYTLFPEPCTWLDTLRWSSQIFVNISTTAKGTNWITLLAGIKQWPRMRPQVISIMHSDSTLKQDPPPSISVTQPQQQMKTLRWPTRSSAELNPCYTAHINPWLRNKWETDSGSFWFSLEVIANLGFLLH